MTTSLRSTGTAIPVMLVIALAFWLAMMRGILSWMGKAAESGNNDGKVIQQAWSGGFVIAIWLMLAGVMLVMDAKGTLPSSVGLTAWFLHPVSCLLVLGAIGAMYEVANRWAIVVPASAPILIAGYLMYLSFTSPAMPSTLGFGAWALVMALCLAPLPAGIRLALKQLGPRGGSVSAEPGPELDRFNANELAKRRVSELEYLNRELSRDEEDQRLYGYERLTYPDSTVREEALAAMRKMAAKQEQAESAFVNQYDWILRVLPDIDVKPTPQLCGGARSYVKSQVDWVRKNSLDGPTVMLQQGIDGIGWLAANCDFKAEIDLLGEMAGTFADRPENREFREKLAGFRK